MSKPWYLGLRKVTFAALVLAALTAAAFDRIIDGTQFVGAVAGLVAAFFAVNYAAAKKAVAEKSS